MAFGSLAKKVHALQQASAMSLTVLKTVMASFPARRRPKPFRRGSTRGVRCRRRRRAGPVRALPPTADLRRRGRYGMGCGWKHDRSGGWSSRRTLRGMQVGVHRPGADTGLDQARSGPVRWTHRTEEIRPFTERGAQGFVTRRARTRASLPCWSARALCGPRTRVGGMVNAWNQTSSGLPHVRAGIAAAAV